MKKNKLRFMLWMFSTLWMYTPISYSVSEIQRVTHFDLPAQSMQYSLIEFGIQAKVNVLVDRAILKGCYSASIVGPYIIDMALSQLLSKCTLSFVYSKNSNSYSIEKGINSVAEKADLEDGGSFTQEEILVVGDRNMLRYASVSNTQLQSGISVYDSARFINILPKQLIEDQRPNELMDVIKYASGMSPGDGASNSNDDVYIRGYQRHGIYVDGFPLNFRTGTKVLPDNVERIEVLKGPSTLLYGQAGPGGIINVVRKKPEEEKFIHLGVEGSRPGNQKHLSLDVNNSIPGSEQAWYRVVAVKEMQEQSEQYLDLDKKLLSTSLRWQPAKHTEIHFGYEYQKSELTWDQSLDPIVYIWRNGLDLYKVLWDPDQEIELAPSAVNLRDITHYRQPEFESEFNFLTFGVNHYMGGGWQLQGNAYVLQEGRDGIRSTLQQSSLSAYYASPVYRNRSELFGEEVVFATYGDGLFLMIPTAEGLVHFGGGGSVYDDGEEEFSNKLNMRLAGDIELDSSTHHISMGLEGFKEDIKQRYQMQFRELVGTEPYMSNPLLTFSENRIDPVLRLLTNEENPPLIQTGDARFQRQDRAVYIQDAIDIGRYWTLSLGTRYTHGKIIVENRYEDSIVWDGEEFPYKEFTSQAGVVLKPSDTLSLFWNYSEAFAANYNLAYRLDKTSNEPERSRQLELGLKSLLFGGRLLSTLAIFDIHKRNVPNLGIEDIDKPKPGGIGSQGLELDTTFEISNSVSMLAGYSYLRARVKTGFYKGHTPSLVPDKTAYAFLNYSNNDVFGINLGWSYTGARYTEYKNSGRLDAFSTLDMKVKYSTSFAGVNTDFTFDIRNLTDEQYYVDKVVGIRERKALGRTVSLGLRLKY